MKILHSADFHYSRDNQEPALLSLRTFYEYGRDNGVDLYVIAGDLFDRAVQNTDNSEEVYKLPTEATETITALLSVENATLQALQDCEKRIKQFIEKREQSNEKYAAHMQAMREAGRVLA